MRLARFFVQNRPSETEKRPGIAFFRRACDSFHRIYPAILAISASFSHRVVTWHILSNKRCVQTPLLAFSFCSAKRKYVNDSNDLTNIGTQINHLAWYSESR